MTYWIITFGCQMNKSDSERIAAVLENKGYKKASKREEADLILVNMCSVRQSAVDRVYGKIKDFARLKTYNLKLKTILTGCILKKDRKKLAQKFDYILNIKDLPKWLKKIEGRKPFYGSVNKKRNYLDIQPKYSNDSSAFIPISNGCNNFCAYCAVPYVRGREISRPAEEIVCEAKNLIKRGAKEIWLLGQNVNSYNSKIPPKAKLAGDGKTQNSKSRLKNQKCDFPKLLKIINSIPGDFWIRFTSSHPKDFSDELIEAMADCEKVTEYLNLPVQAGNNEILKKMNRPYTAAQYKNLVKKIRKKIPDITLSTDIIVGFPGETKKQFKDTFKLFKDIEYDMAYISKFSPRPETMAAKLKDNVSLKEKNRREKVLTEVLKKTALKNNKKYIGKETEALIEKLRIKNSDRDKAPKGRQKLRIIFGRTRSYKKVKIIDFRLSTSGFNLIGKFVKVKITEALPWGLKAKLLN